MLLLSGEADAMWPSTEMAAEIIARRSRADDQHLIFPDAGHFLRSPVTPTTVAHDDDLVSGGTPQATPAHSGRADSDPRVSPAPPDGLTGPEQRAV